MPAPRKFVPNPDQIPLLTPDSSWRPPSELPDLRGQKRLISIDCETKDDGIAAKIGAGWAYKQGYITGVAVAWGGERGEDLQSLYASLRHPESPNMDPIQVARWIQDHANDPGTTFVAQNGGYDWSWMLADLGIKGPPGERMEDTQAAAVMVDENRLSYKLDDLCKWRGVPGKDERLLKEAAAAYGTDPKGGLWRMPARYVGPYAEQDAVATLLLIRSLWQTMREEDTYGAYRTEVELIPMVAEMRRRGVRLDTDRAIRTRDELFRRRDEVLENLSYRMGRRIELQHIDSPRHMEQMFNEHQIPFERTERSGQGSFKNDWMKKSNHWLPQMCAEVSRLHMAGDKFIQGFLLDFAHKGRLHAEIHQFRSDEGGTVSHRFSYGNPPLQQMPSRDPEIMPLIRGLFLPEQDCIWGSHDYAQQEYRLIVHFASLMGADKADDAVSKYRNDVGTDFHTLVAELTGLERKRAKDVNFATAFGAGVNKFAIMTGMDLDTAKATMDQYNTQMPFVKQLAQRCQSLAEKRGWVRMLDGARSHFDMWELAWRDRGESYEPPRNRASALEKWPGKNLRRAYVHKAMNRLIQGSGARQMKTAMLQCWNEGIVPMLQVHDEIAIAHETEASGLRAAEILRDVIKLEIPMMTDSEYGPTWGTAAKVEQKNADGSRTLLYGATFDEAVRLRDEGPWWNTKAA